MSFSSTPDVFKVLIISWYELIFFSKKVKIENSKFKN